MEKDYSKSERIIEINRVLKEIDLFRKQEHSSEEYEDFCTNLMTKYRYLNNFVNDKEVKYNEQYLNYLYHSVFYSVDMVYEATMFNDNHGIEQPLEVKKELFISGLFWGINGIANYLVSIIVLIVSVALFVFSNIVEDEWWSNLLLAVGTGTLSTFLIDVLTKIKTKFMINKKRKYREIYVVSNNVKKIVKEEFENYHKGDEYYAEYYLFCLLEYEKLFEYINKNKMFIDINVEPLRTNYILMSSYYKLKLADLYKLSREEFKKRIDDRKEEADKLLINAMSVVDDVSESLMSIMKWHME